jgi:hypothetical protein
MAQPLELELQVTVDKSQFIKEMDAFGRKIERSGEKTERKLTTQAKKGERNREQSQRIHQNSVSQIQKAGEAERLTNQKISQAKSQTSLAKWGAGVKAQFASIRGAMAGLGLAIGATVIVGAFKSITTAALNYGDTVADVSKATGITARDFQVLGVLAQQSGVEITTLSNAIKQIASKRVLVVFDKLNLGFTTMGERVQFLLDTAAKSETALGEMGFSTEIGKVFRDMAVNSTLAESNMQNINSIAAELAKSKSYPLISDENIKKLDELHDRLDNVKTQFKLAFIDSVAKSSGSLEKFITMLEKTFREFDFEGFTQGILTIANGIVFLGKSVVGVSNSLVALKGVGSGVLQAIGKLFDMVHAKAVRAALPVVEAMNGVLVGEEAVAAVEKAREAALAAERVVSRVAKFATKISDLGKWFVKLGASISKILPGFMTVFKLVGRIAPWIAIVGVIWDLIKAFNSLDKSAGFWTNTWRVLAFTVGKFFADIIGLLDLIPGINFGLSEKLENWRKSWKKTAEVTKESVESIVNSVKSLEGVNPSFDPLDAAFDEFKKGESERLNKIEAIRQKIMEAWSKGDSDKVDFFTVMGLNLTKSGEKLFEVPPAALENLKKALLSAKETIFKAVAKPGQKNNGLIPIGASDEAVLTTFEKLKIVVASIGDKLNQWAGFMDVAQAVATGLAVGIDAMFTSQTENQLVGIQKIIDKEQERWDRQRQNLIDAGAENTTYFKNRVVEERKLQEKLAIQERGIQAKLFDQEKGANIAGTIMNTAQGVMAAWARGPFIGAIMSGIILATGATQVAMIAAQNNPYRRAAGGFIPGQGYSDNVPVLATPGEFVVNRNASRDNADLLQAINSGNKLSANPGQSININIAGNLIARDNWVEEELIPSINNALDRGYSLRMA